MTEITKTKKETIGMTSSRQERAYRMRVAELDSCNKAQQNIMCGNPHQDKHTVSSSRRVLRVNVVYLRRKYAI